MYSGEKSQESKDLLNNPIKAKKESNYHEIKKEEQIYLIVVRINNWIGYVDNKKVWKENVEEKVKS